MDTTWSSTPPDTLHYALRDHARTLERSNRALTERLEAAERKYHELIMAVGKKHPDESRHQTALRYIEQAETPKASDALAARAQGKE